MGIAHNYPPFGLLPFDVASSTALLLRDSDVALMGASQRKGVVGFAYVFEVGQPEPCFYFAINTGPPPSDLSTGEWTYPAGGFDGADVSPEWQSCYALLDAYMAQDDELESRLHEVHTFFRSVMKEIRSRWAQQPPGCVFTVNECHDSDEVVCATCTEINAFPASTIVNIP